MRLKIKALENQTLLELKTIQRQQIDEFLNLSVDFDIISDSLLLFGLKRGHLTGELLWTLPLSCNGLEVSAQMVVDVEQFRKKEKYTEKFTAKRIQNMSQKYSSTCPLSLTKAVKALMREYDHLKARSSYDPKPLYQLLSSPFNFKDQQQSTKTHAISNTCDGECETSKNKDKKILNLTMQMKTLNDEIKKIKDKCEAYESSLKDISQDKIKLIRSEKILTSELAKIKTEKENLQTQCNFQEKEIHRLDPERVNKVETSKIELKAALCTVKSNLETTKNSLEKTLLEEIKLKSEFDDKCLEVKKLNSTIGKLENKNEELSQHIALLLKDIKEEADTDSDICPRNTKMKLKDSEKNRYSSQVRKTLIALQHDGNVPARKCSFVLRTVAKNMFNVDIEEKDLPCTSSVLNMSDEGHVLSKIQAAEKILDTKNCTIHTDGTSRGGEKFLGFQVSLDTGETLDLGYQLVATEDAATLLDVTVNLLNEIHELYTYDLEMTEEEKENIFKQLLTKITSTMTDRVAVMKSYDKKLEEFLKSQVGQDITLHFLHCNAHCLLAFSRACDVALKTAEKDVVSASGKGLGRDQQPCFARFSKTETATSRLIRTASDICGPRGDDKNGCRAEWEAFCKEHGKKSYFTSYRSNRFNCCFFLGSCCNSLPSRRPSVISGRWISRTQQSKT